MGIPSVVKRLNVSTVFYVLIIFTSSQSKAQDRSTMSTDDNSQSSYFFYQRPEYPRDCTDVRNECNLSNSSGVFLIKPNGYSESFEVYCSNEDQLGDWTVIMRRIDGSVVFNRNWEAYKDGFGFLSTEFWLGNDKISQLTNQAVYELRIDIVLSNGTSLFASFDAFRTSDEWGQYKLVLIGVFSGNIDFSCPSNMVFGNCSCQPSCDDPTGVRHCHENCEGHNEACVCLIGFLLKDGECVLPTECGCFITETNSILIEGQSHVDFGCSEKCTCQNGQLTCDSNYRCGSNAACRVEDGVRQCHCNDGYEGDGETCTALYRDCYDVYQDGQTQDGVYTILPTGWPGSPFNVSCDMTTAGGGWTLFQRRIDGVTDFYRYWDDYKYGFGSVKEGSDFWLGNEQLYYLTNQKSYKLRVDIVTSGGSSKYAEYTSFQIGDNSTKYRLGIGSYSGNAYNGMRYTNGRFFSTRDEDNDGCNYHNCADGHRSGWWYDPTSIGWCHECVSSYLRCENFETRSGCTNRCSFSILNGNYNGGNGQNIMWYYYYYYYGYCNLNSAEMKIRPSSA
ncbi:Ryncolin-4 [Holothuria leucospilota]|uniref:Ryncolin-4 n=1 Tax=Holothuria leucospilota TaxID=206669 RepID=A0A9Q1BAL4_HOLLE|nr:Ryncolin-4 [Holothuria leucospilota]